MKLYNHPTKKLGKRAPRIDPRTLKLARYLTPALPTTPPSLDYSALGQPFPIFENDVLGDCVIAAQAHMVQVWTGNTGNRMVLSDGDVEKAYSDVGGWVPGDPSTDNGCDMLLALNNWRQVGIGGHKIDSFTSVNFKSEQEIQTALWLFGGLYLGLNLPLTTHSPTWHGLFGRYIWDVPADGPVGDGSPGSLGGHCVNAVAYNETGLTVVTWGELYDLTWAFLGTYADEAFVPLSQEWIESTGKAPSGFDLPTLRSDLAQITA